MPKQEQTKLIKRSIFWLAALIMIVGSTYVYEKVVFQNDFNVLPVSSTTKQLPIYCVETEKPQVAISFDAAWGNEDTQQILDTLKKYNVKATFFMTGGWVDSFPEDVKAICDAGHDLGNHSQNHKNMSQLSSSEICDELNQVTEKVKTITGVTMELFRPPYGDYDNEVITQAKQCGYYTIQWDIDSLDWKNYGVQDMVDRVVNNDKLKNGSIVLMHNGAKYTAEALPKIIEGLQEKGYEIVPISKIIYRDDYVMLPDGTQCRDVEETSSTILDKSSSDSTSTSTETIQESATKNVHRKR